MKRLDITVATCADCPFHENVEHRVQTDDGTVIEMGHWCLHKNRRGGIATVEALERDGHATLNRWLVAYHGRPFPGDCPLPDAEYVKAPTGKRAVDL